MSSPGGLLQGRGVLVTAAAGAGIGSATARRCAEEGARLVLSDVHERRLAETAEALAGVCEEPPLALPCDVRDTAAVDELVGAAAAHLGTLDVMVNNAGLGGEQALVEMHDDEWLRIIDVSLHSAFRGTRAALRVMKEQRSGCVVNLASVLGWRAQAGQAHYAAAKAGVMALTRCAAVEAAEWGVRVNAVAPSLAMHAFLERTASREVLADLEARELLGRAAEPREVANVIVFLASDLASYMTGEVVSVSAQHP